MSENNTSHNRGMSPGLKAVLVVLGIILSIIIFLIWSAIIRGGADLVANVESATPTESETSGADNTEEEAPDPLAQPRASVIAIVDAPTCDSAETDTNALAELVTVSEQNGGLGDDDRQLIVDTLNKIDDSCPKDFTLDVANRVSGAGVPLALAQISDEADWVTKARPAPDGARPLTDFNTDSLNIHCTMDSTQAACSIYTYTFPSVPESCETYTQTYTVGEASDTNELCSWRIQSSNNRNANAVYANDTFACEVTGGGSTVECWSQLSGKGFTVNRNSGTTF